MYQILETKSSKQESTFYLLHLHQIMIINNKYTKNEKLKSKKDIEHLFKKGKSVNAFPIRAIHVKKAEPKGILINTGVTVSKKNIKLAVHRNLIKRRIREAYRLNNSELKQHLKNTELEVNIMFIYSAKEILPFSSIEEKVKVLLNRLTEIHEVVAK